MAYYNTCHICGSNLDPGERCDCEDLREQKIRLISKSVILGKQGQYELNLGEMESEEFEKMAM